MQPSPKKSALRRRWWIAGAVGAALACGILFVVIHIQTREPPLAQIKGQIRQAVPLGSTKDQLAAWAQEHLHQIVSDGRGPVPEVDRGRTWAETAGVPWKDAGSVIVVTIPCGWYAVNGQVAPNHLWVFFTLNDADQVVDYHFLTLEQLAQIERVRRPH